MPKVELIDLRENTDKQLNKLLVKYLRKENAAPFRGAFFVCAILLFLFSLTGCGSSNQVVAGHKAPEITFVTPSGETRIFSDVLKSNAKGTLLVFWSTWCDVCKSELPHLDSFAKESGMNVVTIAIRDQKNRWVEYLDKNKFSHLLNGFADTKAVLDNYKGDGVPESFLIDSEGNFKTVTDKNGEVVVRMIGAQPWDSQSFTRQIMNPS